jgi:hypothetical protein
VPVHLIAATPPPAEERAVGLASRGTTFGAMFRSLSTMVQSTGGTAHRLDRLTALPQIYETIGEMLRSQYLLVVRTDPGKSPDDWRNIRVELASRGGRVHAPAGYYAPW